MNNLKIGALIMIAFIAGAFIASPELRAYAADTIGSSDIIDESILSADIKNGEVKSADIADSGVTNADIAPNAISTSKINDGAVKTADISNGNVTNAKLAANSVDSSKIVDGSIGSFDIANGQIRGEDVANSAITSLQILDRTVGINDMATDSIGARTLQGISVLAYGLCSVNPPSIDGTDEANQGRAYVTVSDCIIPGGEFGKLWVVVTPYSLDNGLTFCGADTTSTATAPQVPVICLQNAFDQTNVDDTFVGFTWIAFKPGSG
jgi:hypothetical protein